MNTLKICPY